MKLFFFMIIIFFVACNYQYNNEDYTTENVITKSKRPLKINNVETKVFENSHGWGYEIIVNQKIYIHQEHIPAINELKGFSSADDAKRVANFAIKKMLKTQKLPSIKYHELDSLGVLKY